MGSDVGVMRHIVEVLGSKGQSGRVVELVEDQLDDFITQALHGVW